MATSSYSIAGTDNVALRAQNTADRIRLSKTEVIFTVVMLFYTAGAVVPLIVGGKDPLYPQTNPIDLAIKLALYVVAFIFMASQWRSLVRAAWDIRWILVLVLIAILSAAWSQFPTDTFKGSAVLSATTAFGVYLGVRYTVSQQLRLLTWAFSLAIAASVAFAVFLPAYGIQGGATLGDWRGAFLQKNNLAEAMSLALFVFLFVQPGRNRSLRWIRIGACVALLCLARSSTAFVVCVVILMTLPLYKLAQARFTLVIPVSVGVALLLAGMLVILKTDTAGVFELVNRNPDLTGRTELWNAVLGSIAKRPWLGYGFSAFWKGMNGESASVLSTIGWPAGYGHDGYLDVIVQLGALGILTFAAGYLLLWRKAAAFLSKTSGSAPVWLCTYLVFMLLYNITEGYILTQNSLYWALYVSTAVSLYRSCPTKPIRTRVEWP